MIRAMKSLTSTKNLKPEFLLRAYKKGYGYARLRIIDVNEYFLAVIAPEDFFQHSAEGDQFDMYLWKEGTASFDFTLTVLGKIKSTEPLLVLSHTDTIHASDMRKCLKAAVNLPVKYYPLTLNRKNKSFYTEDIVFRQGRIVELSDREAVLQAADELPLTCLVNVHIPVGSDDVEVTGRITSYCSEDLVHSYEIEYIGMSDKDRGRILEYVFTVYRE